MMMNSNKIMSKMVKHSEVGVNKNNDMMNSNKTKIIVKIKIKLKW